MPINDPGNAGTASDDGWPQPRLTERDHEREFRRLARREDPDARRRASSLAGSLITAVALLAGFIVGLVVRDYWAVAIVGAAWLSAMIASSGIVTFRYGPSPPRAQK